MLAHNPAKNVSTLTTLQKIHQVLTFQIIQSYEKKMHRRELYPVIK